MDMSRESLERLVTNRPAETLEVEMKPWLDPRTATHRAKIVKAMLALRNNDGGCLLIGFNNDGSQASNQPSDIRDLYNADDVQRLATKYSSTPFEVRVEFVEWSEIEHPVLCVAGGIKTPVLAKSHLYENPEGRDALINPDDLFVRSINSNGTVSSSKPRGKDWDRLLRLCFENREADIGRFVQRHFTRENIELLKSTFQSWGGVQSEPNASELAREFLDVGRRRLGQRMKLRGLPPTTRGMREVSAIVFGEDTDCGATPEFLHGLFANKRMHSGWTPWADSRNAPNEEDRPKLVEDGYESLLLFSPTLLDFWRVEPKGRFYHARTYQEDYVDTSKFDDTSVLANWRGKMLLDYTHQIQLTAEAISTVIAFAQAIASDEETGAVMICFRWSQLQGRFLINLNNPLGVRLVWGRGASAESSVTTEVEIPLTAARTQISQFVQHAVHRLFLSFDNTEIPNDTIERIVNGLLSNDFGPG